MPEGLPNYLMGGGILALKAWLLPRVICQLPGMALYLAAACATSVIFIGGFHTAEPAWSSAVAILGVVAALECSVLAQGISTPKEQAEVQNYALALGLALVLIVWAKEPAAYPDYSPVAYFIRLYAGTLTVGWLVAAIGYGMAVGGAVRLWLWHSVLLLVRITAMTGSLLVHDRSSDVYWLAATVGGAVNILTLAGWLWLIPHKTALIPHSASASGYPRFR